MPIREFQNEGRAVMVDDQGKAVEKGLMERCSRCGEWILVQQQEIGYTPSGKMVCRPCWPVFDDVGTPMRNLNIPAEYATAELADFSAAVQRIAKEWPDRSPFFGILGPPRRGKTRLVWALARTLHRNRRFVTMVDCRLAQVDWMGSQRREEMVGRWMKAALLVLDDLSGGSISPGWRGVIEKVIDARKQNELPTCVVTMLGGDEFEGLFGQALRSRLHLYRWLNWPAKEPDRRPMGNDEKGGK